MPDDSTSFLNDLPIWKLKLVAAEYRIDISNCRYKRDYVEKIRSKKITQAQAREAIAKAKKGGPERKDDGGQADRIERELELIAAKPVEVLELPEAEEKTIEKNIDEALTIRPSFFDIDSTAQSAYNRMIVGDFYQALKTNRDARLKSLEMISNFEVYSSAVSIRAADELLTRLHEKMKMDPNLKTALAAAKKSFVAGSPRLREQALESLETLACKTYEAAMSEGDQTSEELKALLTDYESFGTRTEEARKYLDIAAQAKQAFDAKEYKKLVRNAKQSAEVAREFRRKEIENAFDLVKASAAEAKQIGAPIDKAETALAEAKTAFDDGWLKRSLELLADAEKSIDSAHLEAIRRNRDLEASQTKKVSGAVRRYEPAISEAMSYGIDVDEAATHLGSTKAALLKNDIVAAAKFSRRLDDVMIPVEKELDHFRIEKGVLTPLTESKCEACGSSPVYAFSDGTKKCVECKRVYPIAKPLPEVPTAPRQAVPFQPAAEPKRKRGFFRW